MGNLDALALRALMNGGIFQYPDKNLYNAAVMLTPEERPKAPVRLSDGSETFLFKSNPKAEAFYDPPGKPMPEGVTVNRESEMYKSGDLKRLAAVLAHEAAHQRGYMRSDDEGRAEAPAYAQQAATLERLGFSKGYVKALRSEAKRRESQK